MVLLASVRFGWGMAPSSPPPPPPCWASCCSRQSPWSLQQFSESPSIFSSNRCMRFNLGYCFWNSDNKQRNYTWCHNLLVNSWWWWLELGTRFREISPCPQKAPTWAFSFLKAHTSSSALTNKHLLRNYAKLAFKHGKNMRNLIMIDPGAVKFREVPLTALIMWGRVSRVYCWSHPGPEFLFQTPLVHTMETERREWKMDFHSHFWMGVLLLIHNLERWKDTSAISTYNKVI